MGQITVSDLNRLAIKYQPDIKMLPYAVIAQVLGEHGINLFPGVQYKDVIISFLRKQGIAKPYAPGLTVADSSLGKMQESTLEVAKAYASVKDNIWNYVQKQMVTPDEMLGKNVNKKHPFEVQTMMAIIRTFAEDVLDCMFNGERDIEDQSPLGLFDGFETKVVDAVAANEIAAAEGNLIQTGIFVTPATSSDFTAYTFLRDWVRQLDPALQKNANIYLPRLIAQYVFDALQYKTAGKAQNIIDVQQHLNAEANANVNIIVSRYMGSGQRIYAVAPGYMDFGLNTAVDANFVQVRDIYDDPNEFQYWIQADWGTRWRTFHKKVFTTNEGTLTANQLSGDYS